MASSHWGPDPLPEQTTEENRRDIDRARTVSGMLNIVGAVFIALGISAAFLGLSATYGQVAPDLSSLASGITLLPAGVTAIASGVAFFACSAALRVLAVMAEK